MADLKYPKYQKRRLKILHFHEENYFLGRELADAFSDRFELRQFIMQPSPNLLSHLLQFVAEYQPDFVLSVNYRGFDSQGELYRVFKRISLDVVVWFVDNPFYLLSQASPEMSSPARVFLWDSAYIEEYKERFHVEAEYLPLATSKYFMRSGRFDCNGLKSFVGSSMIGSINRIRKEIPLEVLNFMQPIKKLILGDRSFLANITLESLVKELGFPDQIVPKLEEFIRYKLTSEHRQRLVLDCAIDQVYGDSDWNSLIDSMLCFPSLEYYSQLPMLFERPGFHFNLTHFQMPNGVNQRVFDVVNCGGVLLTDKQSDLLKIFPEWAEWCYSDIDEVDHLMTKIINHQNLFKKYFRQLQLTVRQDHFYNNRLDKMVALMLDSK